MATFTLPPGHHTIVRFVTSGQQFTSGSLQASGLPMPLVGVRVEAERPVDVTVIPQSTIAQYQAGTFSGPVYANGVQVMQFNRQVAVYPGEWALAIFNRGSAAAAVFYEVIS